MVGPKCMLASCPLVGHSEYAEGQMDGCRTYVSARCGQRNNTKPH